MSYICTTFAYMEYIIKENKFTGDSVSLIICENVKQWLESTSIVKNVNGTKVYIVNGLEFEITKTI